MSTGLVCILYADLGMPPWDVFHLGLLHYVPITYGQVIQGLGLIAILVSYFLGVKPHIGTFLNMFFIGFFVDVIIFIDIIPYPQHIFWRSLQFLGGLFLFAYGTMGYILLNRGTGPRDSLMVAFSRLTGFRLGIIRTIIEVTVTVVGFALGGPLGVGTVVFALGVGPCMEVCTSLINWHNLLFRRMINIKNLFSPK